MNLELAWPCYCRLPCTLLCIRSDCIFLVLTCSVCSCSCVQSWVEASCWLFKWACCCIIIHLHLHMHCLSLCAVALAASYSVSLCTSCRSCKTCVRQQLIPPLPHAPPPPSPPPPLRTLPVRCAATPQTHDACQLLCTACCCSMACLLLYKQFVVLAAPLLPIHPFFLSLLLLLSLKCCCVCCQGKVTGNGVLDFSGMHLAVLSVAGVITSVGKFDTVLNVCCSHIVECFGVH